MTIGSRFTFRLPLLALAMFGLLTMIATPALAQTYTVLHTFTGQGDGGGPNGLIADQAGNLYGTTYFGGTGCGPEECGTVFRMTPSGSGWVLNTLYTFGGANGGDGQNPYAPVVFGPDGSLYGTTIGGGQ